MSKPIIILHDIELKPVNVPNFISAKEGAGLSSETSMSFSVGQLSDKTIEELVAQFRIDLFNVKRRQNVTK